MKINGRDVSIEALINTIDFSENELRNVGSFFLTKREMDILEHNFVEYKSCTSLKDLMMKIQHILDDDIDGDDADDLEFVLNQISERDYYQNTRK